MEQTRKLRLGRPAKDTVFMQLAIDLAELSTCQRRAVGCVLVDKHYDVLGMGYNGVAAGEPHCLDHPCPGVEAAEGTRLDDCEALHAEWNALLRCRDHRRIWTAFVVVEPGALVAPLRAALGDGQNRDQ